MTSQAALTEKAIAGLRRATGRDSYSSDSDDVIQRPTNRGNKLKRKAEHVHEGQLDRPNGLKAYKKRIRHAGYERAILGRNPKRFDEDGDELDDDVTDEEADGNAAARNPYSHIKLEELLAPLTSAAELPLHPSLSIPYLSSTLTNMARQACTMLHREKQSLYAVKNLLTKFRGDDAYILCGSLNDHVDEHIFDIKTVYDQFSTAKLHLRTSASPSASLPDAGKANSSSETVNGASYGNSNKDVNGQPVAEANATMDDSINNVMNSEQDAAEAPIIILAAQQKTSDNESGNPSLEEQILDTAMEGIETKDNAVGPEAGIQEAAALNDAQTSVLNGLPLQSSEYHTYDRSSSATAVGQGLSPAAVRAGRSPQGRVLPSPESLKDETNNNIVNDREDVVSAMTSGFIAEEHVRKSSRDAEDDEAEHESQPEPRRMRTRAQAQAASDHSASSCTKSPSPASRVPPVIHPLFRIPDSAHLDPDFGLPPNEAEDTRRLLTVYVQKQEEIVRGAEKLHDGLLRADRMRQIVFKWCKAEGHVGEMSDGEDWYDKDEWGLDEDLEKGKDEEEETAAQGKKTRGKTRQQ